MTTRRPTLLHGCAAASSAAEARFRIDAAPQTARATRVVALDDGAAATARPLLGETWRGARFLRHSPGTDGTLTTLDGVPVRLADELAGADFVMMIATTDDGAPAAAVIGDACTRGGIMTAGVVLRHGDATGAAVAALRPHARVLLVSEDEQDVSGLLTALGA